MFESFFVALRVVAPMALLMGLGVVIRCAGITDRSTMRAMDKVCFRVFLPLLLFKNIYETDLSSGFGWKGNDHFRIVMLPEKEILKKAMEDLGDFLSDYKQK